MAKKMGIKNADYVIFLRLFAFLSLSSIAVNQSIVKIK